MTDEIVDATQIDQSLDQWDDGLGELPDPESIQPAEEPGIEEDTCEDELVDNKEDSLDEAESKAIEDFYDEHTEEIDEEEIAAAEKKRKGKLDHGPKYYLAIGTRSGDELNLQVSAAVKKAFRISGISRKELAERLGVSYNAAANMLTPKAWRLSTLAKVLACLGKKAYIQIKHL